MVRLTNSQLREQCRELPQKFVLELFGFTQWVELQRFAAKWKLPLGGAKTDLFAVFQELRSFTKQFGPVLKALIEDVPPGSDVGGELGVQFLKAKIRKTRADADAAELRVDQKAGRLLDREKVHEIFERLAARVQRAGDKAQSRWGSDGHDFMLSLTEGFAEDIRGVIDLADQPEIEAVE